MELVSLIWFLQIWVAIYVFGTMINWSTLIKKLMQTYIVKVSGSVLNISTVHLSGIWHIIWCYLSKPVLGGHPVSSRHYSIPQEYPLNTGFTVPIIHTKIYTFYVCLIPICLISFLSSKHLSWLASQATYLIKTLKYGPVFCSCSYIFWCSFDKSLPHNDLNQLNIFLELAIKA